MLIINNIGVYRHTLLHALSLLQRAKLIVQMHKSNKEIGNIIPLHLFGLMYYLKLFTYKKTDSKMNRLFFLKIFYLKVLNLIKRVMTFYQSHLTLLLLFLLNKLGVGDKF